MSVCSRGLWWTPDLRPLYQQSVRPPAHLLVLTNDQYVRFTARLLLCDSTGNAVFCCLPVDFLKLGSYHTQIAVSRCPWGAHRSVAHARKEHIQPQDPFSRAQPDHVLVELVDGG